MFSYLIACFREFITVKLEMNQFLPYQVLAGLPLVFRNIVLTFFKLKTITLTCDIDLLHQHVALTCKINM